ncbi:MAG: perB [Ilumatobacteraceae bacterium]|nr:perB [Ilumatobacteraceae bacterium]
MAALPGVIFVGGGGHAAVCLDVFRSAGRIVLGYVAPQQSQLNIDHLGTDGELSPLLAAHSAEVFVAIGDNSRRLTLFDQLVGQGFVGASAAHASAVVDRTVRIGAGTVVMAGVVVNARSAIGNAVILNTSSSVDHDCVIGDGSHVGPGSHLAGSIHLGRGCFLGVGVSVVPGITIGERTTVGAGGTVIGDLPAGVVAVGVPAAVVRTPAK